METMVCVHLGRIKILAKAGWAPLHPPLQNDSLLPRTTNQLSWVQPVLPGLPQGMTAAPGGSWAEQASGISSEPGQYALQILCTVPAREARSSQHLCTALCALGKAPATECFVSFHQAPKVCIKKTFPESWCLKICVQTHYLPLKGLTVELSFMLLHLTWGRRQKRTPGLYHVISSPGATKFCLFGNRGNASSRAAHNSAVGCADIGLIVAFTTTTALLHKHSVLLH